MSGATTSLTRNLAVGECISLDGGRIVVTVLEKTGRRAALRVTMARDVVVDRPGPAANDPVAGRELMTAAG